MIVTRNEMVRVKVYKEKITETTRLIRHQDEEENADEADGPKYEEDFSQEDVKFADETETPDSEDDNTEVMTPDR